MWFRRYWSVFFFTPVGFFVGFAYSVFKTHHPIVNHIEQAGRDTGSAIMGAFITCVVLILYNRSRKIEPKKKPEAPPSV